MLANATAKARLRRGELGAAALAGAGAFHRPPCSPAELAEVTPLLLGTGGGSLGWWRVRSSGCRTSPPGTGASAGLPARDPPGCSPRARNSTDHYAPPVVRTGAAPRQRLGGRPAVPGARPESLWRH